MKKVLKLLESFVMVCKLNYGSLEGLLRTKYRHIQIIDDEDKKKVH